VRGLALHIALYMRDSLYMLHNESGIGWTE
jgi:hypothetical protein